MTGKLQLSDEALDKFEGFLRRLAANATSDACQHESLFVYAEDAKALVDQYLPAPVDPLVLEARKLADDARQAASPHDITPYFATGHYDDTAILRGFIAALKRGQELAHAEYLPNGGFWMTKDDGIIERIYCRFEPMPIDEKTARPQDSWPAHLPV